MVELIVGPSKKLRDALLVNDPTATLPAPIRVTALIDTGASVSVVNEFVIRQLGINPIGSVDIHTPSTTAAVSCRQFHVDVLFPNGVAVPDAVVIEMPLGMQNIQCLIGRDILRHGVLVYIGYANQFTLSF